jgi:hypothetical protein
MILLDVQDTRELHREVLDISDWPARGRAGRLAQLGVDMVICGGQSGFDEAGFDGTGIRLISGVAGPIDEVVRAACSGTIESDRDYRKQDSSIRLLGTCCQRSFQARGGTPCVGGDRTGPNRNDRV